VVHSSAERLEVRVVRGKSRFRVPRGAKRRLKVVAGQVEISVYAAEFSVACYQDVTDVWAHQGEVIVLWNDQPETIAAGEHRRFQPREEDVVMPADLIERERTAGRSDWRALARDDRFEEAYRTLRRAGESAVRNGVADHMLAADVYRMSGHPREALAPLRRVVKAHSADPRAPLAAFTLGRVLLDDLGQPAAAARAFRSARAFAPSGALAEDALAREVEAWSKAGQENRARERAEVYLRAYPRGHRARSVKRYGGM
jgi:transmembrane sensor